MSSSNATNTLASLLGQTQDEEMDCDAFLEWMAAKADGMLPAERRPLFEHHRAICPECEDELQALMRALEVSVVVDPCD